MATRSVAFCLAAALLLTAAKKPVPTARGENEDFILVATLHVDPAEVKELVGNDLEAHYIVAEIKIDPKYGKEVSIDHDDFVILSGKDGEKAKPYKASQIAGQSSLVLSAAEGTVKEKRSRWGIGLGGGGMGMGTEPANNNTKATMQANGDENPLKKILDEKALPEKKTTQAVSGLLYFPMEKQKLKDLELIYGLRTENRIALRFK